MDEAILIGGGVIIGIGLVLKFIQEKTGYDFASLEPPEDDEIGMSHETIGSSCIRFLREEHE